MNSHFGIRSLILRPDSLYPMSLTYVYVSYLLNSHLRGRGTIWYSQSEWHFLLKFLCTKIVKQFVFLVQSIVFIHIRVQWFWKIKSDTHTVVWNCCRTPIPKFRVFMLPLSLGGRSLRFFENENFAARALGGGCAKNFFFFYGLRTSKSHSWKAAIW